MNYSIYKPSNILSKIVSHYWTLDGSISDDQTYVHRTTANFYPELIFHYGGIFEELVGDNKVEKTFRTGIHGQTDKIRRFTAKKQYGIFGAVIQPYAIPALFGISSTAISNELIDLTCILGQEGENITEQIILAGNTAQRVHFMNCFLEQRIRELKHPEIVDATQLIYNLNGQVNVKNLADQTCLSQRQFERKFKDLNGFSAKSFARIVRFKSLLNKYKKGDLTLTEVAYDFGYYDQSHFIQDFKQFSGYNPNTYFSGKANEVFYAP